jgi:general secretion pathway protein F
MSIGSDYPGRLGRISTQLGQDLANGKTLAEAVAAEEGQFPPLYRAVVESGMRSGRLSLALEALAEFARSYQEMRRAMVSALTYPLLVLMFGYILAMTFMSQVIPRFVSAFGLLDVTPSRLMIGLERASRTVIYWGPILPAVVVVLILAWVWTGRARSLPTGGAVIRRIPWMRAMLANAQAANFARLLALLVEHDVPLADAIDLAAGASAGGALMREGRGVAERLRQGATIDAALKPAAAFPPLLKWLMITGQRQHALVGSLNHAAVTYKRRALMQAELARTLLPTIFLVLIGAVATYLVVSLLFVPFTNLLTNLSQG